MLKRMTQLDVYSGNFRPIAGIKRPYAAFKKTSAAGKRPTTLTKIKAQINIFINNPSTSDEITPAVDPIFNLTNSPLDFTQMPGFNPQMAPPPVVPPKSGINVALVAVVLGLLSRAIMLFSGPINIGILWAIFYVTLVARFSAAGLNNQTRNELAAVFQAMGNGNSFEKIMNAGFMLIEFIQTTVTFAASFLLAHLLLEVYDFSADYQLVY